MVDFLSLAKDFAQIPDTVPREDIRKEGDFYLEKAELITFDGTVYGIDLIRLDISIYEDLYNQTMAGSITFSDSSDLVQLLPLIGEEKLKLKFTRPSESGRGLLDESFEMQFRIYKMDNRRPDTDKINRQNYCLNFVSEEKISDMKSKVWETYTDIPYSDMVQRIYNEYLKIGKSIEIESTKYDHKFCASGLTPLQTIAVISSRCVSDEGNGSAFIFFEDVDKFNFKSLGQLLKQDPVEKYISQPSNVLKNQGDQKRRDRVIEQDVRRVENYLFPGSFDVFANMDRGMYSQRLIALDILRQFHTETDWDYKAEFAGLPHLRKSDICTDGLDALGSPPTVMKLAVTTKDHDIVPHIVARDPKIKPNHVEEYLLKRPAQFQQNSVNRLHVNISGDPRRRVGQVVEFFVPNHYGMLNEDHRPDPPFDRYLGGKFLITALKHRIGVDRYYMEMELVTDTFSQDIEGVDINEFSKWTY